MRTVARRSHVVFLLGTCLVTGLAAQQPGGQEPAEQPKGTGLLMGQIVDASSGRPVGASTVIVSGGTLTPTVSPVSGEFIVAPPPPPSANSAPRQILTDAEGRFLFRELTKGRYTIRVTAPGYIAGSYGQTRPSGAAQSIELTTDDEKKGNLTIRMWKTASISGTVIDEIGEPVAGQNVRTIRRTISGGVQRLSTYISATTDDRGIYRISNLTPGEYLVGVMLTEVTMPVATMEAYRDQMQSAGSSLNSEIARELNSSDAPYPLGSGMRVGDLMLQGNGGGRGGSSGPPVPVTDGKFFVYPTTYYPAASVTTQATIITLGSGEDRAGVDLQLKLSPSVRVSGVVTGPQGPQRNLGVKLIPAGADDFAADYGVEAASTVTDGKGEFTFLGVTPGQYTLKTLRVPQVARSSSVVTSSIEVSGPGGVMMGMSTMGSSSPSNAPLPTDPTLWATMPVNVGDADVTGLNVSLRPGVRLGGRIEFDGAKEKPTADQIQRVSISMSQLTGSVGQAISSTAKKVETDGRFNTLGYPPGRYLITASLPVAGWTLRNVTLAGRDVSNEGLDVAAEDISGLVITFTDRTIELNGSVRTANGTPDPDASVVAFPADSDNWKRGVLSARRMRLVRTTSRGAYSFAGLPAGAYYIAAISDSAAGDWQDLKTLEALSAVATRITLEEGDKKSQELTTKVIR